jgi:hypothetical protein
MRPESPGSCSEIREPAVRNTDRAIAEIAARQRGVVSRAQLLAAGIHGDAIKRRLRSGRLHPMHRGVYLVVSDANGAGLARLPLFSPAAPAPS